MNWTCHSFFLNGGSLRITSTVNVKASVCSAEPEANDPESNEAEANESQGYLSSKENPGKVVLRRPNVDDYTAGKFDKLGKSGGCMTSLILKCWGGGRLRPLANIGAQPGRGNSLGISGKKIYFKK